jgi:4-amino-4-deoxy-L-arabinose transferase-like glycosyltransferase
MDVNSAREFLNSRVALWIGALTTVLFLVTNLPWQLDDYDQAKQAFTSFEMVKEGHWLYQRTPHERIATKPPLVGWTSAAVFELTRSWGLAWRLPSFAGAIAMSILLFRAGSVFGPVGGLVAASAFAFNLLTPRLATLVRTDMPLALAIFLIGLLIWEKVRTREAWSSRDRCWVFVLLTAAMLIKGPIVYAFLLPGIAMFEFWERRRHVRQFAGRTNPSRGGSDGLIPWRACHHSWFGWWPWVASLGIFLLWAIGGSIFVPGFFDQVVVREFVARFGETVHRSQPLFF